MTMIAVWKDSAFGLALVWTTTLLLRARMRGALIIGDGAWLGVSLALPCLFRHNGPAVALPILCGTAWSYRRTGLGALLMAGGVLGILVWFVMRPVYRLVEVTPASPKLRQQAVIHPVAGLLSAHTPLTSRERKTLGKILPIPVWRAAYVCHSGAGLRRSGLRTGLLRRHPLALVRIWA